MRRLPAVALALVSSSSLLAQSDIRKNSVHGDLRIIENFESKLLQNKRSIRILLPKNYNKNSKLKYPVVYMHDGQNLFDGMTSFLPNKEWRADEIVGTLVENKLIPELIIVGIDNAGMDRGNEYLPTSATMGSKAVVGGKADLYTKFITDELMPFVNSHYRTKLGPKNTATCGSSFGGIIALHMGLTRPDVFGMIGAVSPSIWWDDRVMIKTVDGLKSKLPLRIWIDAGTKESLTMVSDAQLLAEHLVAKGWKRGKEVVCYIDEGGEHNETWFSARLPMVLSYLLGKN